jgi:hypothetical protein
VGLGGHVGVWKVVVVVGVVVLVVEGGIGFWCLVFGFWCLDFGVWILVFGVWILVFGFWILVFSRLGGREFFSSSVVVVALRVASALKSAVVGAPLTPTPKN